MQQKITKQIKISIMKLNYLILLAASAFLAASCSTQSASRGASSDDIYFSAGDPVSTESITTETTTISSSESYSTYPGTSTTPEYSYSAPQEDVDYRMGGDELAESETYYDDEGNTYIVNNYYDDNDYDDFYYTSSIYRFYYPYNGFGYNAYCYSPYYYDPFWGPGWNVGWNSWNGWYGGWGYNAGWCYSGWGYNYGWGGWNGWYGGWGNPYGWGGWGYPYGYYDPWGYNYGYWNGYNNGYWNGYYDGYYDGYYGNGNGYYGYDDSNYYYGPNTGTGTNTNTGVLSSTILNAGYDKTSGNTDQNHVLTDKGELMVTRDEVNTKPGMETGTVDGTLASNTIKGELSGKPGSISLSEPVALNDLQTGAGNDVTRNDAGVRVIKYYSADTKPVSEPVASTTVLNDRGARGPNSYTNKPTTTNVQPSKPVNTPSKSDAVNTYQKPVDNTPKTFDRPEQKSPVYSKPEQQKPTYSKPEQKQPVYQQPDKKPVYEQPASKPNKTYEQPSKPSKTYEQPSKPKYQPSRSYDPPKSSSPSPKSGSYNSGSSNKPSSSGSKPSNSGSRNRSGGK